MSGSMASACAHFCTCDVTHSYGCQDSFTCNPHILQCRLRVPTSILQCRLRAPTSSAYFCTSTHMPLCMGVCERERERGRESVYVCACVFVRVRVRVHARVCVRARECVHM